MPRYIDLRLGDVTRSNAVLDSRHWKLDEASMPFQLDGDLVPTSRTTSRRTWISSAEGGVVRVGESHAWIAGEHAVALRHTLPDPIDLRALIGRRVRVTLVCSTAPDGSVTQTLTISGDDGRLYLVAHAGHVKGNMHTLGSLSVYVALSQRPGGPMVFGTSRLQSLVRVGDTVKVQDGNDSYVLHFQSRPTNGSASYVIANKELWHERKTLPL
jgi:hypothetical protein